MDRHAKADSIRDAFLNALKSEGASVRTMIELAEKESDPEFRSIMLALGRAGREVYLVSGVGFINVHVRSEPPGWWNILKTVKEDLAFLSAKRSDEPGINWYYILLIGRGDHHVADGYIATDFDKPPFTRPPGVEKTKYTINERQHLDSRKLLLSVGKVAKTLLQQRQRRKRNAP